MFIFSQRLATLFRGVRYLPFPKIPSPLKPSLLTFVVLKFHSSLAAPPTPALGRRCFIVCWAYDTHQKKVLLSLNFHTPPRTQIEFLAHLKHLVVYRRLRGDWDWGEFYIGCSAENNLCLRGKRLATLPFNVHVLGYVGTKWLVY